MDGFFGGVVYISALNA